MEELTVSTESPKSPGNSTNYWGMSEGSPSPLGLSWVEEEQAYNFALYSKHATGMTLKLFAEVKDAAAVLEYRFDYRKNKSGRVWHCRVPFSRTRGARYYAYVVDGPHQPEEGQRFDPEKLLLDPYARTVAFPPTFSREAAKRPGSNAGKAPLGVLECARKKFDWGDDPRPRHTFDTVIYEMHVKGFTQRANSGVRAERRGTYAGLVGKVPYLKELGVTAVELLPVHQYDPGEGNYWGYMTLNFFAPHRGYARAADCEDVLDEFRSMIKAFHEADIEVILDVAYSHTTESDHTGPTYSFRGIDNTTYYLLAEDRRHYRNDAGTGNVLHCANRYVRQMVIDSLRFWVKEMHVDGFRFDLASIFTRNSDGSINLEDPPIISAISGDPDFQDIRLIAEAWDISSYQLGRTFPGTTWLQWNGAFRDDLRAFVKGENGKVGVVRERLYGSSDFFPDSLEEAYHPHQSVNFITCHDGFCLYDLVSYNNKHNEANGHGNTDGTDYNLSWNCGWEGDINVPAQVVDLRKRQVKNFCSLLFLANGTPMFCAGDEFLNTQCGNNNPYNQDNETTWLNWDLLDRNGDVFRFFQNMIAFRKRHPSLGRSRFWRDDVRWYGTGTHIDLSHDSHSLAFCLHCGSQNDSDIYVMINAYWKNLEFTIQEGESWQWRRIVDTGLPSPHDFAKPGKEAGISDLRYLVKPRSIVILERDP